MVAFVSAATDRALSCRRSPLVNVALMPMLDAMRIAGAAAALETQIASVVANLGATLAAAI